MLVLQEKLDADLDAREVDDLKTSSRGAKQVLDLESLAFSQGSHLMANKKCVLPEGTTLLDVFEIHPQCDTMFSLCSPIALVN